MSTPAGGYDPRSVESRIYALWEARGCFHADPDPARRPFTIVIPPPNVTGALHLGHALNNTLQDILIRRKRMQGFNACWLPGTDHAGIATQAVVEKRLKEEQNLSRHDVGRDGLVERIWAWKEDYNARILGQLRRMGCSCDWPRTRFTLDEQCGKAVYETFFRFFKDGLIYRGLRLVNWDTQLQTAVADDEVYHETVRGHLWHVRYPILSDAATGGAGILPADAQLGADYLVVATTRPETMLADTAVAVHPDDERYKHLHGGQNARPTHAVVLPLTGRTIPVVADGLLVKREFGTGCVKVTPGHDPNDYACWQRKLGQADEIERRNMMTPDGRVHADNAGEGGKYAGLKMEEARKRIVADLEAAGLLEKVEPYETDVGHSDRSKTPIQPFLSEQWFVAMDKEGAPRLAEVALDAVRDGRVRFFPERYAKSYLDWLGEKRDWCISRQLWWGHRIPVWTAPRGPRGVNTEASAQLYEALHAGQVVVREIQDSREFATLAEIFGPEKAGALLSGFPGAANASMTKPGFCPRDEFRDRFEKIAQQLGFIQDPDVLDTWFSSALWPFSTFGWPGGGAGESSDASSLRRPVASSPGETVAELDYFYPTSVLSTARDIITLWVARMVMTGLYNTGRVPFQHVYIHGVIQDAWGSRMSKSAGNGIDPLDLIDAYGADGMRFSLAQLAGETQDIRIPGSYRCPHCSGEFPQQPADLKKTSIACRLCKKEFATRVADDATIARLGLGLLLSPRFEYGRNFVTKLWQAATGFVLPNIGGSDEATKRRSDEGVESDGATKRRSDAGEHRRLAGAAVELAVEDRWILSRLAATIESVDRSLESYLFNEYINTAYAFFWSDFCDWYIELAKPRLYADAGPAAARTDDASSRTARDVLAWVLDQSLRLLHPAIPFVTEALWEKLSAAAPRRVPPAARSATASDALREPPGGDHPAALAATRSSPGDPACAAGVCDLLIAAEWPRAADSPRDLDAEREIGPLQDVIRALRDIRTWINGLRSQEKQSAIRTLPAATIRCDAETAGRLQRGLPAIRRLAQVEALSIGPEVARPPESTAKVLAGIEVFVSLSGLADLGPARERLGKEREEVAGLIAKIEGTLANAGFVAKAPPAKVEAERTRLAEFRERLTRIEANLAELAG